MQLRYADWDYFLNIDLDEASAPYLNMESLYALIHQREYAAPLKGAAAPAQRDCGRWYYRW